MRTISLLMLIAAVSVGCGKKDTPATTGGTGATPVAPPSIEGEYLIIGGEFIGEAMKAEEVAKDSEVERTFKISKDTIEIKLFGKEKDKLKYTIDPSKSPAEIDIVVPEKGKKDEMSYGIYKLEGDQLTLFIMGSKEAKNRPKEFKTLKPDIKKGDQDGGFLFVIAKKK